MFKTFNTTNALRCGIKKMQLIKYVNIMGGKKTLLHMSSVSPLALLKMHRAATQSSQSARPIQTLLMSVVDMKCIYLQTKWPSVQHINYSFTHSEVIIVDEKRKQILTIKMADKGEGVFVLNETHAFRFSNFKLKVR